MSYTTFSIQSAGITTDGSRVSVKTTVFNTGDSYSGKEVVQLYVSAPNGNIHKEYQSLVAFEKTELLQPGLSQSMELKFDLKALASYRETDASYVLEKGEYILRLGNSSRNTMVIGVLDEGSVDGR